MKTESDHGATFVFMTTYVTAGNDKIIRHYDNS